MSTSALAGALVVFAVVGGLELVDRTNFSLIALASRQSPWHTFLGGTLAFVAATLVAVSAGAALVAAIGSQNIGLLRIAGGAFLVAYAVWLAVHPPEEEEIPRSTGRTALIAAFVATFLLELGDTTMIFEIVFVTTYGWLLVLVAGASALVCVAAVGCTIGRHLGVRVDPARLHGIVVAVLLIVGALTILYGVDPGAFGGLG